MTRAERLQSLLFRPNEEDRLRDVQRSLGGGGASRKPAREKKRGTRESLTASLKKFLFLIIFSVLAAEQAVDPQVYVHLE